LVELKKKKKKSDKGVTNLWLVLFFFPSQKTDVRFVGYLFWNKQLKGLELSLPLRKSQQK